jgi:hypothetical protein
MFTDMFSGLPPFVRIVIDRFLASAKIVERPVTPAEFPSLLDSLRSSAQAGGEVGALTLEMNGRPVTAVFVVSV